MESEILLAEQNGVYVLKLVGNVRFNVCHILDNALGKVLDKACEPVVVDLTQVTMLDSTALGILAQIAIDAKDRFNQRPHILVSSNDVKKILLGVSFDKVFLILEHKQDEQNSSQTYAPVVGEIPYDEKELTKKVLDAHKTLSDLSDSNRQAFKSVLETLEFQVRSIP